jgi:hypothetical protein
MPTCHQTRIRLPGTVLTLLVIAACAGNGGQILERMDSETGATITRASAPFVMYRDMSAKSAFGREYVYVGPVQVNNMGERRHYLWLGIWGTSDSADRSDTMANFETIVFYADGEPLNLEVTGWTPGVIGASDSVYVQPVASALGGYYRVTTDQLRLIAASRDLEIRAGALQPQRFFPWDSVESTSETLTTFLQSID